MQTGLEVFSKTSLKKKAADLDKKEAFVTINTLKESTFYSNPKLPIES